MAYTVKNKQGQSWRIDGGKATPVAANDSSNFLSGVQNAGRAASAAQRAIDKRTPTPPMVGNVGRMISSNAGVAARAARPPKPPAASLPPTPRPTQGQPPAPAARPVVQLRQQHPVASTAPPTSPRVQQPRYQTPTRVASHPSQAAALPAAVGKVGRAAAKAGAAATPHAPTLLDRVNAFAAKSGSRGLPQLGGSRYQQFKQAFLATHKSARNLSDQQLRAMGTYIDQKGGHAAQVYGLAKQAPTRNVRGGNRRSV